MNGCSICGKIIRRNQPHYRGAKGQGPWKHIACCFGGRAGLIAPMSKLMQATKMINQARWEMTTHKWQFTPAKLDDALLLIAKAREEVLAERKAERGF
jgi:hypothetical protein